MYYSNLSETFYYNFRTLNNFLISQPKHVVGAQWDGSFEHPKHMFQLMGKKYLQFYAKNFVYPNLCNFRALTRILKTGVQDSHLAKSRSPTGKSGSPNPKKLSPTNLCIPYLFHFSRKWYIWIIFRLTDFNPLSINVLFLLNKKKIFWYIF